MLSYFSEVVQSQKAANPIVMKAVDIWYLFPTHCWNNLLFKLQEPHTGTPYTVTKTLWTWELNFFKFFPSWYSRGLTQHKWAKFNASLFTAYLKLCDCFFTELLSLFHIAIRQTHFQDNIRPDKCLIVKKFKTKDCINIWVEACGKAFVK